MKKMHKAQNIKLKIQKDNLLNTQKSKEKKKMQMESMKKL